jgi:hypothetical protein
MTNPLRRAWHELQHLFVDDGSLAAFSIVLIGLVACGIKLIDLPPLWGGAILVVGCAGILAESLQRAAKVPRKKPH